MKRRVLIVDDDAAILEVLEMRLTAMGFEVTATSQPQQAVDVMTAGRFDLAVLDLRMEPLDGIQLMERLHARQPRLPVLIMTAHGTIETAVEAVQRGAFDYLTKPFVRDELRAKIRRALSARRWARDRERLLAVGETFASSGVMERILDAVVQAAVEPTEDDLELLALFSSQAAIAIRNTHELERLRSGALAALGRMATQVAHELKNPLAGLRLYARHLEQRLEKGRDVESADLARKVTSTVDHLTAVVSEITAFGRPPELHRAPTSLAALLDECMALARARCPSEGIEIVRSYDPACPEAQVDARELRKAFLNLILNGLEALNDRGRLTVGVLYTAEAQTITVAIDDTGPGMGDETLARVFDLFFTTKPDGTGLGMAIARSVIDLHGGELTIQSSPGHGTRVRIRIPVGGPAARPEAEEAR